MPTVTVALPQGDVGAGRQAFLDLRCTACHAVPSEPDFPAPVSANPGPPIDARLASRDVSYLMASIMTPSHAISINISDEVRASLGGVLSPMGDFSRVMTVRQLVDLHAYVRSVK
jgi:mono/diheme cytochrome c family protein